MTFFRWLAILIIVFFVGYAIYLVLSSLEWPFVVGVLLVAGAVVVGFAITNFHNRFQDQ